MITEFILFDVPNAMTREAVMQGMHEVVPRWRANKALIRKTFIFDPVKMQAGAFYLWKSRAAAESAHDDAWRARIRQAYGSEPSVRYSETPLVIDNALDAVISEDSISSQ